MPLKAKLDNLDGLDPSTAALYAERTEGDRTFYLLDVEPVDGLGLENPASLKAQLDAERESRKEYEHRLKDWDGIDVKAAREAIEKLASHKPEEEARKYVDAELAKLHAEKDAEVAKAREQVDRYRKHVEDAVARESLVTALRRANILAPEAAAKVLRDRVQVERQGDSLQAWPVDKSGRPRLIAVNGKVSRMTLDDFVRECARTELKELVSKRLPGEPSGPTGTASY